MDEKRAPEDGKFDFSTALADVLTRGRDIAGLTQTAVSKKTRVDKKTIISMEKGEANPTLEKLRSLIRFYGVDPRPIFFPEMVSDARSRMDIRVLLETCSEKEAAALIPIVRAVLDALRDKDGNDLANNS